MVLYDVPCRITDDEQLQSIYDKSLNGIVERKVFEECVRVVKRMSREGQSTGSLIVDLLRVCKEKLMRDGRLYLCWLE